MSPRADEHSYRRAAIEGASSVTLVIMLYDRMIADIQRAVAAMRNHDIETRCTELKHALLILQQLEGSLDHEQAPDAAQNLGAFYAYARTAIMQAQLKLAPGPLEKLIHHVLDVKSAWQKVKDEEARPASSPTAYDSASHKTANGERAALSCTV